MLDGGKVPQRSDAERLDINFGGQVSPRTKTMKGVLVRCRAVGCNPQRVGETSQVIGIPMSGTSNPAERPRKWVRVGRATKQQGNEQQHNDSTHANLPPSPGAGRFPDLHPRARIGPSFKSFGGPGIKLASGGRI